MDNKIILSITRNGSYIGDFEGWTDININLSCEKMPNTFSISLTSKSANNNFYRNSTLQEGDICNISLNQNNKTINILKGYIEGKQISYSKNNHSVSVSGRDIICDLMDSSIIGNRDLQPPYTPVQLCNHLLNSIGITNISVINKSGITDLYEENLDLTNGNNAGEILLKYLKKKSIFPLSNFDGDLVLFRGAFGINTTTINNSLTNTSYNNVISSSYSKNIAERFNKISIVSQGDSFSDFENADNQGGDGFYSTDSSIRSTRQIEIEAPVNMSSKECKNYADFQRNIRNAKDFTLSYTLKGFTRGNTNLLWLPNFLVQVKDDFYDIDDYFLIKNVNFKKDLQNGSTTILEITSKNAFTLIDPSNNINSTLTIDNIDF